MDTTFAALADPTRRSIVEMLARRDHDAGSIASAFPTSRPAVSRHLRVLREAGLVTVTADAQRRVYRLDTAAIGAVEQWAVAQRAFWSERLDRLEALATGSPKKDGPT